MIGAIPLVGREALAAALQTLLAGSKVKLFSENVLISVNTIKTDLTEADFSGYLAQTVAATNDPVVDPVNGGISITMPNHLFATDDPTATPNTIHGWWLELAGGDLIMAGNFDAPIQMTEPFQGIPLALTLNF